MKKLIAEFIGTFWLARRMRECNWLLVFRAEWESELFGVSLAFGLTVLTMAYAVGHISGGHFNPAVSVGLWSAGGLKPRICRGGDRLSSIWRHSWRSGFVLDCQRTRRLGDEWVCFEWLRRPFSRAIRHGGLPVTEIVMTFMFLMIILGATQSTAPGGFAGMAIGLGLTLVHFISIPVTNTSVNPARNTAAAIFEGGWAVEQLWLFWLAPIIGAALAGLVHKYVLDGTGIDVDGR